MSKRFDKLNFGESSYNHLENRCKQNAKNRSLSYSLSREEFRFLISQNCKYCNETPKPYNAHYDKDGKRSKPFRNSTDEWATKQWISVNGIDRVENSIGYSVENCVPCCPNCNDMKCDKSVSEFITHVQKIILNLSK